MNAYKPLLIHNTLNAVGLLADAIRSFTLRCVAGMEVEEDVVSRNVERSLMLATALTPRLGYDKVAEVVNKAAQEDLSLKDVVVELGYLTADEFETLVSPHDMAGDHGRSTAD
jgi:fumarate hydratase class II